jgi:hypothetical protein
MKENLNDLLYYEPGVGDKLLHLQLTAVINWAGKSLKKVIH